MFKGHSFVYLSLCDSFKLHYTVIRSWSTRPSMFSLSSTLVSLASNRAHSPLLRTLNTGVRNNPILVVADCRLGDRADIASICLQHIRMVWWEDGGSGADDGAEGIIKLLCLGLVDSILEGGALGGCGRGDAGDGGVLVEVVVVVCCCAYHGALRLLARERGNEGRRLHTVWPSILRSTSGWLGGRTWFVVPMTGQVAIVSDVVLGMDCGSGECVKTLQRKVV